MSGSIEIDQQVFDWVEQNLSEQLDDLAAAHDPDAEIPLRGESIRVSLASLAEDVPEAVEHIVSDDPGPVEEWIREAVRTFVSRRVDLDYKIGTQMEDGWAIEWVDPIDEMTVDISSPLSRRTGELVAIRGRIRKRTDPIPWIHERKYECKRCLTERYEAITATPEHVVRGIERVPVECENEACSRGRDAMTMVPAKSDERDYQYITVEQSPGVDGSQPAKLGCWIFGEGRLVQPSDGERVTIVGRLRLNPDTEPAEHYVDVSSVITDRDESSVEVSENDRNRIHEMVTEMDDPLATASENLAPHVYGHDLAKRGLTLVAVGGGLDNPSEQTHAMLIGDPSTAKTELTSAVREVFPSTRQASLTQSSSVGLTASAIKEAVAGSEEWVIRAGAFSLASGSVLTIDELDEADFDLSKLNDALSEGEIPVDKAGESTRIKTDTRVIATANPEDAEFDPYKPLGEQIQFSADVVSRFDLAFPFIDEADDEELNRGIMNATAADYLDEDEMSDEHAAYTREIDLKTYRKWLTVAQEQEPTLTAAAMDEIEDAWMLLRGDDGGVISINARRLRSVVRLARAHARLRLGDEVTRSDAKAAFRLVSAMLGEWGFEIKDDATTDSSVGGEVAEPAGEADD